MDLNQTSSFPLVPSRCAISTRKWPTRSEQFVCSIVPAITGLPLPTYSLLSWNAEENQIQHEMREH